jgi:hypothetical protein
MLPAQYATPAAVVLAIGGLLTCFVGYRLFRFVLGLTGFIVGAMVSAQIMGPTHTWTLVLAALIGGIVGAVLMIAAYFIGVGLVGAGLAALALNLLWRAFGHADPPTIVLVLVCVLGALGALSIVRYVAIFGTALLGSWTFIVGALALAGDKAATSAASGGVVMGFYPLDPVPSNMWIMAGWFVLALLGALAQFATTSRSAGKKKAQKS